MHLLFAYLLATQFPDGHGWVLGPRQPSGCRRKEETPDAKAGPAFDLAAATPAVASPLAEVFAVVREQPVPVLAEAQSRAADHFIASEAGRTIEAADSPAGGKLLDRNLFHRAGTEPAGQTCVVDDLARSCVEAVMLVATTVDHEVGASGWLPSLLKAGDCSQSIMGCPPLHGGHRRSQLPIYPLLIGKRALFDGRARSGGAELERLVQLLGACRGLE